MNCREIEQRESALARSCGVCAVCGKPLNQSFAQFSHRIANKDVWRKKYGSLIIDHTLNGEYACSTEHNYEIDVGSSYGNHLDVISDIIIYEYEKMWGIKGLDMLADKVLKKLKKYGINQQI